MKRWFAPLLILTLAIMPGGNLARASGDSLIEGAKLCTKYLPRYEREYAIPTHLLSAIASTESGRFHEGLRMRLPWPWAINAEGKGYYFASKAEAIAAVKKMRAQGIKSIDVGCMQVNIMHHADAFASLNEAFEPQTNIAYAAGFLRTLYDGSGTWKKAAADYHSKTPSLGREYVGQVYDSWYQIIDKLRAARLHVPESSVVAMNEMRASQLSPSAGPKTASRPQPKVIHVASVQSVDPRSLINQQPKLAAHEAPRMNSIRVSNPVDNSLTRSERAHSVIVVKSDLVPTPSSEMKLADNRPLPAQPTIAPAAAAITSAPAVAPANAYIAAPAPAPQAAAAPAPASVTMANNTPITNVPPSAVHAEGAGYRAYANNSQSASGSPINQASFSAPLETSASRRSGPNFIFND